MICGRTLLFVPVIAISLLSGIAHSADEIAPGPASTTEGNADRPTLRPVVEISDDATATWRLSHNETATNLRFIKPTIPGRARAAAPARALATDGGPSSESIPGYRKRDFAPTQNVPVKRIDVKTHVAPNNTPTRVPTIVSDSGDSKAQPPAVDRQQLAGATAAKLQQLIEQPKPQLPAAIDSPNQPAGSDGEIAIYATNAPTQFHPSHDAFVNDETNDIADKQVIQASASAPRQIWAASTRLLQGIGNLFPMASERSTAAQ
ncbi:MAG TPA: hypothetical protein VHK01_22865 [Lacipirellulaceae bacterium]|nr:hypothetical protein [Lacipirellulaceae bacterium]